MALIFLSYRRVESAGQAGRLYDHLAVRFGRDEVYMDRESGEPGDRWQERLVREVEGCRAFVALIGRGWIEALRGREGKPDYLRLEVATALRRHLRIFPVLVDGVEPPSAEALPEEIRGFAGLHAIPLHDDHQQTYEVGVSRLLEAFSFESERESGQLDSAREALKQGRYETAIAILEPLAAKLEVEAQASTYLALARLAGRPFNALRPKSLARVERDLQRALRADEAPLLALAVAAAFVLDYFDLHGMVDRFGLSIEAIEERLRRTPLPAPDRDLLATLKMTPATASRLRRS